MNHSFNKISHLEYHIDLELQIYNFFFIYDVVFFPFLEEILSCHFNKDFCDWHQGKHDKADWVWTNLATPSLLTGPNRDHTTGSKSTCYLIWRYDLFVQADSIAHYKNLGTNILITFTIICNATIVSQRVYTLGNVFPKRELILITDQR